MLTGEHGYYFDPKISNAKAIQYLEKGIVPVQEELDRRNIQIRGTLIKEVYEENKKNVQGLVCLLYTSPSPRDRTRSRMPSSA